MLRQLVLPSHDAFADLKAKGKLPAGAFVFEADYNEELDAMPQGLPHRGLIKFGVTPLESVGGRRERDRQQAEQIEQSVPTTGSARDRDESGRG